MLKCITIYFSESRDLTVIKFTKSFENAHWILIADVLKDSIYDLTELYQEHLQKFVKDE